MRWILLTLCCLALPALAEPDFERLSQEALPLLQDYIRLKTVNPPADTRASAELLRGVLAREGIEAHLYESGPGHVNLVARLPGKTRQGALLLLHHMDVVPADAARWPVDPFGAVIQDGMLYGRGAVDMKSLGIMQLMTFIALAREGAPLEHDLVLLATADEESGGEAGARWMIARHWPDVEAAYVLDEGGFGTRDLFSDEGKLIFGVAVGEKQILWGRLTATGTSGHGSQPVPDNANDRLLAALAEMRSLVAGPTGESPVVAEFRRRCGRLADNKFTRAIQADTMSLTSLRSGVGEPPKVNVIPPRAEATVDLRLLPGTDVGRLQSALEAACARHQVAFETIHATRDNPVSAHDTPLFRSLERALLAEYPEAVVAPYLVPFGTDSNAFRQQGCQAYGFGPAVVSAAIVASMHSDSERLPVNQITPSLRIYYRAVAGYLLRER